MREKKTEKMTKAVLKELHHNQGLTYDEIGKMYNVSRYAVYLKMKEFGLNRGKSGHRRPEVIGKRFGKLLVEKKIKESNLGKDRIYKCVCDCGFVENINETSLIAGRSMCTQCKNKHFGDIHWKGYEEISMTYWNDCISGAKRRELDFDVSIEYAWNLYIEQNKKCALSRIPIWFNRNRGKTRKKRITTMTASLDRIDSNVGYVNGNVQWLHKDINSMKSNYDEDVFIYLCKWVAQNN